jgi:hypothetical protein
LGTRDAPEKAWPVSKSVTPRAVIITIAGEAKLVAMPAAPTLWNTALAVDLSFLVNQDGEINANLSCPHIVNFGGRLVS